MKTVCKHFELKAENKRYKLKRTKSNEKEKKMAIVNKEK